MNQIDVQIVREQVGPIGMKMADSLCRWLAGGKYKSVPFEFRIAPSIITRSECELLGLSAPRFAIRKYVDEPSRSGRLPIFFNLRRLVWLANAIERTHGNRLGAPEFREEIEQSPYVIADSLLDPSRFRAAGFHVLTADLGRHYGESVVCERGTPFLQHLKLGGGMCAQACLFMAICLQERYANSILGVAELTASTKKALNDQKFSLRGLTAEQMVEVLRSHRVGLTGFLEGSALHFANQQDPLAIVGTVWKAYLHSNVPVIVLVDLGVVSGAKLTAAEWTERCIWGRNHLTVRPDFTKPQPAHPPGQHAVVLVGCSGDNTFLFNDPALFPFLKASLSELNEARIPEKPGKLQCMQFIPVLPAAVRMPLLGQPMRSPDPKIDYSHRVPPRGLLELSFRFQTPNFQTTGRLPKAPPGGWPGMIRLVDSNDDDSVTAACRAMFLDNNLDPDVRATLAGRFQRSFRQNQLHNTGRWKWFQGLGPVGVDANAHPGQIWVWNAEFNQGIAPVSIANVLNMYKAVDAVYERGAGCFPTFTGSP